MKPADQEKTPSPAPNVFGFPRPIAVLVVLFGIAYAISDGPCSLVSSIVLALVLALSALAIGALGRDKNDQ